MPYPGLLHPEPLALQQATADPYLCRRHSNTVLAQSLWDLWVLVCTGLFESSKRLWLVLGLILNVIFLLLPSYWVFTFALGHVVSFFGGVQHFPVNECSATSCNFGVLAGEDEHTFFFSTIL